MTQQEKEFLIKHYPDKGKIWCCKKLNKTEGQVRSFASKIGLKQNRNSEFFKQWQNKAKISKIGKKRPIHSAIMKEKAKNGELWLQQNPPIIHGLSEDPCYITWQSMMYRCYGNNEVLKKQKKYKYWKGKGIEVCEEWHNIITFALWFDKNYKDGLTLDRIDGNGNYSPNNCRFVDWKTQANNRCTYL